MPLTSLNETSALEEESPSFLDSSQGKATLCVYMLTFILGSIGNVLVLLVVQGKKRRTINDLFIVNLAISDLLMIGFLPVYTARLFVKFHHSTAFCKTISPLATMTFFVSVFTLTSMAIHRCYVITNPFKPEIRKWKIIGWLIGLWLASFLAVLPLVIVAQGDFGTECDEGWPSEKGRKAYTASLFVLQYSLPLAVISAAYIRIAVDLLKSSTERFGPGKSLNNNTRRVRKEDIQILKTIAVIVLVFAICLLPVQLSWMMTDFGGEREKQIAKDVFWKFDFLLSIIHSCLNPLVYGTLTRRFRRGYIKYLICLCPCMKMPLADIQSTAGPSQNNSLRKQNGKAHVHDHEDKIWFAVNGSPEHETKSTDV